MRHSLRRRLIVHPLDVLFNRGSNDAHTRFVAQHTHVGAARATGTIDEVLSQLGLGGGCNLGLGHHASKRAHQLGHALACHARDRHDPWLACCFVAQHVAHRGTVAERVQRLRELVDEHVAIRFAAEVDAVEHHEAWARREVFLIQLELAVDRHERLDRLLHGQPCIHDVQEQLGALEMREEVEP